MKPNSNSGAFQASSIAKATLIMLTLATISSADNLSGIGYLNLDEGYTGVTMASFAGGTELLIKGKGFNDSPSSNLIQYDEDNDDVTVVIGPDLSEDNTIRSCPHNGVLQYTTPTIGTLFGTDDSYFDGETQMNMYLSVYAIDDDTGSYNELSCSTNSYCKVKLSRYYTPILYEVAPPVQYAWGNNTYVFDPTGCQDLKQDDELAFVSVKVDDNFIGFEDFIDEDDTYSGFYRNYVSGQAGENEVNTTSMPGMFFYPGRAVNTLQQMTTCSYDNETCYQMMTVAKVDSINMPEGYTTGGQNLSIEGYGFTHGNISITVDGVECVVTSYDQYAVNCETGASSSESTTGTATVGGQGVRYSQYNYSSWINPSGINDYSPTAEYIHTALVSTFNTGDWMAAKYSGYFKAPATAQYRFYMSCDNYGSFDIATTNMDTSSLTEMLYVTADSDYKEWDKNDGQTRISDWISLAEGEYYYYEMKHTMGTGTDFVQVGVEIEQSDFVGHHHSMKEVQKVGVVPLHEWETTRLTMSNCDEEDIYLAIMDPDGEYWATEDPFTCGCSASTLKSAIKDFYSDYYGTSINVEKWSYDADGNETDDSSLAVSYSYNVTMDKLLSSQTTTFMMVYNTMSASTIDIEYPSMVQVSSTPLGGRMKLRCFLEDGSYQETDSMSYDIGQAWFQYYLNEGCTYFRNKVRVEIDDLYSYKVNGRSYLLYFEGFNGQPGQFELMTDTDEPLTGEELEYPVEVVRAHSDNIFYENIPFEFLYTAETAPQVEVYVEGVSAVCASLDCSFAYFTPSYEISDVQLSGSDLTMTGSLPVDLVSVSFGGVDCEDIVSDGSTATCTLAEDPTAGVWDPIVKDQYGIIPTSSTCPSITINLIITSISPDTELNSLGEDYVWIYGSGFPITDEPWDEDLSITFHDGTVCDIKKSMANTMLCLTQPFASTSLGQSLTVTISVNGVSDTSLSVGVSSVVRIANSVSPASYSPVLKTNVMIFFDSSLDYTLETEDLYVTLVSTFDDSTYDFNVVAVDNDPDIPSVTFRYGGAWSGVYDIKLFSDTYGLVDTAGLSFEAVGTITDFTPSTIGVNGGALITISGYHFGDVDTDNPVKVGRYTYCYVQETSEYEIKCRVDEQPSFDAGEDELIVFLRTSEEATCQLTDCMITIIDTGLPTVSSMSAYWDDVTQKHLISIQGTDFTADASYTEFKIDGYSQIIQSVSSTEVIVEVNNTLGTSSTDLKFYLMEGIPDSHSIVEAGISLDPKILAINPQTGSTGGSVVNATVSGVGTETEGVTLVDTNGNDMCSEVTIPEWGIVSCLTVAGDFGFTQLSLEVSGSTADCIDSVSCEYGQTAGSMPAVSGANINGDTEIVFSGSNFLTTFSGFASFAGINADSVSIDSDSQATATWDLGVPIGDELPVLQFVLEDDTWESHYADMGDAYIYQPLDVSGSTFGLECSFNGGCMLEVNAVGLASSLKNPETTSITVCEETCVLDEDLSSSSTAVCELSSLRTTYSQDTFEITQFGYLTGTLFGSANSQVENVFDDDNLNTNEDWDADCYFGMYFPEGYEGFVNEVKLFLGSTYSKDYFVDYLTFQGSDDGNTYNDLFTLDASIHEGWNYFDFAEGEEVSYRFYRFYGSNAGACLVNEAHIFGVEVINDSSSSYSCTPHLNINDAVTLLDDVSYSGAMTPTLDSISPRYGSVYGGDYITFTGEGFSDNIDDITVLIDDIECVVSSASTTEIVCLTGDKPGLSTDPSLQIYINGVGLVANGDHTFYYVYLWSDENTWGGEFVPAEGDSVHIPTGMNVLFDMDSTPVLNIIIVEGSLIFAPDSDPDHERSFDCYYFLVSHGTFQVGTEDDPYTSKMTFTMYGEKADPSLPTFGNKVLAVHYGTLDIHGVERYPTWTELEVTADVGATQITLREAVDWQVGEEVVIAPTSFEAREAEKRTITAIDNSNPDQPVLTLDTALANKHFAGTEYFGNDFIDMRAEVGLLTRNVKYQGDPDFSEPNQYGATIMLHSDGDDTSKGRISYTELFNCGQAFKVGKYPIHFHMIGYVSASYVRGNAIHQSYNRATTIHGVHGLTIQNNVIYKTMGHNIFIEDAAETNNIIEYNLLVQTMRSWSLLNTDQTPGSMWITHPDNIIRFNHAAGSDRYSYWYDLQDTAIGPSFDPNICPINAKLGEFEGNVAHSNGRYGLRIFHGLRPRTFPCQGLSFDHSNQEDPYHSNPVITANFYDLVAWKNKRNGAITESTGDVRFHNFKTADNILAGIEFSLTNVVADQMAGVYGGLVVGKTSNTESSLDGSSPHGIITARTENMTISGVSFYNFDFNSAAGLGTCSHCFHDAATDSGARTITVSDLFFDDSVTKRIKYQTPFRAIFHDLDGTLTDLNDESWASYQWNHLNQEECSLDATKFDGVVCNNNVQMRRVAWHSYTPSHFDGMGLKIYQWDDELIEAMTEEELEAYLEDSSNYSEIPYKAKQDPIGWAVPYVTGHVYRMHWQTGLDFLTMTMTMSERWTEDDRYIRFVMNFTDVREAVNITNVNTGQLVANDTLEIRRNNWNLGDNLILNDTETREIHVYASANNDAERQITFLGLECLYDCYDAVEEVELETDIRYWSNASSWTSGAVPVEGEYVEVESGWNMYFDLEESPILDVMQVNGRLTFPDDSDHHLQVKHLYVRAGEIFVGSEEEPFTHNMQITLMGEKDSETLKFDNTVTAGNKVIVNTGHIEMHGIQRTKNFVRLLETANVGDDQIVVEAELDLVEGDALGLLPTGMDLEEYDYVWVSSYDASTGVVTLDRQLSYLHFGAAESTEEKYGVDMRGEVLVLSRNVRIVGEDIESWGGNFLTADKLEVDLTLRSGTTILDSVEIYNCSQQDTYRAALRFEGNSNSYSTVSNSAIHGGLGWAMNVQTGANLYFRDNVWFKFLTVGVQITDVTNMTFTGNVVGGITERVITATGMYVDKWCAVCICTYFGTQSCPDIQVTNNIVGGAVFAGFTAPGHECDNYNQQKFKNNVAHSVSGMGARIYPDPTEDTSACYEGSYFTGYKNQQQSAIMYSSGTSHAKMSNIISIDNVKGVAVMNAGGTDDNLVELTDSTIWGEVTEIPDSSDGSYCNDKTGLLLSGVTVGSKDIHPTSASALPIYKIKSDAAWGGRQKIYNVDFYGWDSKDTACGGEQHAIGLNPYAADYIQRAQFLSTYIDAIDDEAFIYIPDPPQGWATISDCGNFPCTAPQNVWLDFKSTSYGQSSLANEDRNFQVISDNEGFSPYMDNCFKVEAWNAWHCNNENIGHLVFQNLDTDAIDRAIQPIYYIDEDKEVENKLNAFMDHIWDGFYTGQQRVAMFPGLVETDTSYEILYTSTEPKEQKFILYSTTGAMKITINFQDAGVYRVSDANKNQIEPNDWDTSISREGEIQGNKGCGENRFQGVEKQLQFYITDDCLLHVQAIDLIMCNVRLQWTFSEFYAAGGTTTFADRITAALGIHASQVKVASVYEGSLVVDFYVTADEDSEDPEEELENLEAELYTQLNDGAIDLGAEILEVSIDSTYIISDSSSSSEEEEVEDEYIYEVEYVDIIVEQDVDPIYVESETTTLEQFQEGLITDGKINIVYVVPVIVIVIMITAFTAYQCLGSKKKQQPVVNVIPDTQGPETLGVQTVGGKTIQQQKDNQEYYEDQYNPDEEFDIFDFDKKKKSKINDADCLGSGLFKSSSDDMYHDTVHQTESKHESESKMIDTENKEYDTNSQLKQNDQPELKKSELPIVMQRRGTIQNIDGMFNGSKKDQKVVEMDAKNVQLTQESKE